MYHCVRIRLFSDEDGIETRTRLDSKLLDDIVKNHLGQQ